MAEQEITEIERPAWPRSGPLCPRNLSIHSVIECVENDRYREDHFSEYGDLLFQRHEDASLEPWYVSRIVAFMDTILNKEGTPLIVRKNLSGRHIFRGKQYSFVELVELGLGSPFTRVLYYCEQAETFFRVLRHFKVFEHVHASEMGGFVDNEGNLGADLINKAFEALKAEARSARYRRKIAEGERRCGEAFKSCSDYVDALFKKHSRLLVGRIDMGFDKLLLKQLNVQKVEALFKSFKNRLRSTALGRKLIGYIWCLECTAGRGYHYHTLLFFDGSKHQKHEHLVQEIGNQWVRSVERDLQRSSTQAPEGSVSGKASFYNCNRTDYQSPFLGQINHNDALLRDRLLKNIAYICKAEQLLGVKVSKGMRTMGRGELPKLNAVKPGRPRKDALGPFTELQKPQS